jgi:hypothetical protein
LTLSYVDLSIVVTTVWMADFDFGVTMRKVDINFSVVVSAVVWKIDVDVCFGVSVFRSERRRKEVSKIEKEVGQEVSMSTN